MKVVPTPAFQDASHAASQLDGDGGILKEVARRIRQGELSAPPDHAFFGHEPEAATRTVIEDTDSPSDSDIAVSAGGTSLPNLDPDHFAKLAHELKTPLTAIAAAAEVMRDERLGKMQHERYLGYAADIHESAKHALDVITALLSRNANPDAARTSVAALDLNAVAGRTVSSMQALAESRGLVLAFDADGSRPHVIANPTAMRQILLNLLANAIKFTPRDGDVRVATGHLDDGRVFLAVRDTGCGMDGHADAQEKAPADEASQPSMQGNGIGLPLVRRLVREMAAEIEIDSAFGKGTVVLIAFPRLRTPST